MFLVAVLWGCWLVQKHYLSQARRNVRGATLNIQQLQRKRRRALEAKLRAVTGLTMPTAASTGGWTMD
jgi:hypothetical protein